MGFSFRGYKTGLWFHTYEANTEPVWNYETGMKPAHQTTSVKPVWNLVPKRSLFEAGLKRGMKPDMKSSPKMICSKQVWNQVWDRKTQTKGSVDSWLGVLRSQLGVVFLDQDRIQIILTPSSLQTMGRATAMKPRLER